MFVSAESINMWNFNQGNPVIKLSVLRIKFDRIFILKSRHIYEQTKKDLIRCDTYIIELF